MTCIAIDIGGTRIKLGVAADGKIVSHNTIDAHADQGIAARLPAIEQAIREMPGSSEAQAISVAFPGIITRDGRITSVPEGKFTDAPNVDLPEWARARFNLPCRVENDARVAALGEWRFGAGRGVDDLVMITLGTGIGVGVIVDGKPLRGAGGGAGILSGHLPLSLEGRRCACGGVACAENFAAQGSLANVFADLGLAQSFQDFRAVFAAHAQGDPIAGKIVARCVRIWATHAVAIVHAFNPQIIAYGGGLMASAELILPGIRKHVDEYAWRGLTRPRIEQTQLGDHAALLGGQVLMQET